MIDRRSLVKTMMALVGKSALPQQTVPTVEGVIRKVLPKVPVTIEETIRRILCPYDWSKGEVKMLSPTIYSFTDTCWRNVGGTSAYVPKTTFGHVESLVKGLNYDDAMLKDPVGRGIFLKETLEDTYYPSVDPSQCNRFFRLADEFVKEGRMKEARLMRNAGRASAAAIKVEEKWAGLNTRPLSPQLYAKIRRLDEGGPLDRNITLEDLPRACLKKARSTKEMIKIVEAYKPRKKDKTWWDAFYSEYRSTRSRLALNSKWREHRWMHEIVAQKRRCWSWTREYKLKRFRHFSTQLTLWQNARAQVLEALVEHASVPIAAQGQYSNIGVETCLRVLRRFDALMSVPMEALHLPPDIDPFDVGVEMLYAKMKKLMNQGE